MNTYGYENVLKTKLLDEHRGSRSKITAGKYLNSFILTSATPRQTEDELLSTFVTHTQNISAWTLGHHG